MKVPSTSGALDDQYSSGNVVRAALLALVAPCLGLLGLAIGAQPSACQRDSSISSAWITQRMLPDVSRNNPVWDGGSAADMRIIVKTGQKTVKHCGERVSRTVKIMGVWQPESVKVCTTVPLSFHGSSGVLS